MMGRRAGKKEEDRRQETEFKQRETQKKDWNGGMLE
jgi:hypothetical protein